MRFGEDFNPSVPTDGDFVRSVQSRQLANEIRDVKERILDFFGGVRVGNGTLNFDDELNSALWPVYF